MPLQGSDDRGAKPTADKIHYRCGPRRDKYQTRREHSFRTPIRGHSVTVASDCEQPWLSLTEDGTLTIRKGYAWDGPSSPAIDTNTWMRASLVHDALYQLMRTGDLDPKRYRKQADDYMRTLLLEDGMCWFRAWYSWRGIRWFGGRSAQPDPPFEDLIAP